MSHFVALANRAERDLGRLSHPDRARIRAAFEALGGDDATDVKALTGRPPWLRLRVGDHRILYRPLTAAELVELGWEEPTEWLIARVVHRSERERAVRGL